MQVIVRPAGVVLPVAGAVLLALVATGCSTESPATSPEAAKVGLVLDPGGEEDRGFNEFTLKGAREAAEEAGLEFTYTTPAAVDDYERVIEATVAQGAALVVTVGFRMAEATASAARRHPDVRFVIVDVGFFPGAGCPEDVDDCYTEEGGLANVTSLLFAEAEVAYLAGTLAACVSESHTVAVVGGIEIPPVVRFVEGYRAGATATDPEITVLSVYLPTFEDPDAGEVAAQSFIADGADVVFAAAGSSGNGALVAAAQAGVMAIGVDVDQYHTVPEAASALLTSASKNVDVASAAAVADFSAGTLAPGIRTFDLANGGIGLAPYHDWEDRVPATCKQAVDAAQQTLIADPSVAQAVDG